MNITCDVVCDLLPLYHDEICSADSKALVEEHLNGCASCSKKLELMGAELSAPHIKPESESALKAVSAAWKSRKRKSFIKGAAITVLICALLVGVWIGLTQWEFIPISTDVLEVKDLSMMSDGCVAFKLVVNNGINTGYLINHTETEDGCCYLTPMRSVIEIPNKLQTRPFSFSYAFFPPGYRTSEPEHPGVFISKNVTKIYIGPVGEGVLVWEAGMELPAATEAIEQAYFGVK